MPHLIPISDASKAVALEGDDISCRGRRVGIGLSANFTNPSLAMGQRSPTTSSRDECLSLNPCLGVTNDILICYSQTSPHGLERESRSARTGHQLEPRLRYNSGRQGFEELEQWSTGCCRQCLVRQPRHVPSSCRNNP